MKKRYVVPADSSLENQEHGGDAGPHVLWGHDAGPEASQGAAGECRHGGRPRRAAHAGAVPVHLHHGVVCPPLFLRQDSGNVTCVCRKSDFALTCRSVAGGPVNVLRRREGLMDAWSTSPKRGQSLKRFGTWKAALEHGPAAARFPPAAAQPNRATWGQADDDSCGAVPRAEEGALVAVGCLGGEAPPRVPQDEPCLRVPGE